MQDMKIVSNSEIDIAEDTTPPERRTLREIFDRDKAVALDTLKQVAELIPDIALDQWSGDDYATDDNRPMRALCLARQLCVRSKTSSV